ncbi:glycosyltransferase family 2 protein [bacterium]|nr:glycosyltransferase family 2 protein [bacterium]
MNEENFFDDWQVPSYDTKIFKKKSAKYCVCIFVINEGEKIKKFLGAIKPFARLIDIIIADGGSTDGSLSDDIVSSSNVTVLLTKTGKGKLSAQMRMAFDYSLKKGYEGIITIDGNNKDDPCAIEEFVKTLDEGYDHIQGSRFIKGGVSKNLPLSRFLGIKLVHSPLISLASGFRYTDTTNGFRAYSRKFLIDKRTALFRDIFSTYELHYYLAIRAVKLGFKVTEVPVTRVYPDTGEVPTKISPFKGNLKILKILAASCLGKYNP